MLEKLPLLQYAASHFQKLFAIQFDSKSSWLEEKGVHYLIIQTTISFFIACLLEPAAFCKKFIEWYQVHQPRVLTSHQPDEM